MTVDLKTVSIKPLRQTFVNVAARVGGDKPASRYQEGVLDVQANANFHYRPTWDPDHEIFDSTRTALRMKDWYLFKDPRQFYYGNWTMLRARQQDAMESNFDFVESRDLLTTLPADVKATALEVLLPLRHVAWGANMNNSSMCAYGYGTAITAPCMFHAMDQLGIAQYLTRLGLLLADPGVLDAAKQAWVHDGKWQELRRYVEDTFVLPDWFEMFVAQNLVQDGLLYPLVYGAIVDDYLAMKNGSPVAMLTAFMTEWFDETQKWVDAQIKTAVAESPENQRLVSDWARAWRDRAVPALAPIAGHALADRAQQTMDEVVERFSSRCAKLGLTI